MPLVRLETMASVINRALVMLLLAACGGSPRKDPESPHEDSQERRPLDRCLSDEAKPLDAKTIVATWQQIARGEKPSPLKLRTFSSGICEPSWWTPVGPSGACSGLGPRWFLTTRDAGTIVVDQSTRAISLLPPGDEMFEIDGYTVIRRSIAPGSGSPLAESGLEVVIESAAGSRRVPGFPEHIIDDTHAIVATPGGMSVYDLAAGKLTLPVRPRAATKGSVAATIAVPDPRAPNGARLIGGLVFDMTSEAFAITGAGKLVTSVRGPAHAVAYPAVAPDGTMILAAYRSPTLEIATITPAGAKKRTTEFPATLDVYPPRVLAERDLVVVVIGAKILLWRTGAEPITIDLVRGRLAPKLLAGGNVLVVGIQQGERDGTIAIDTRTGTEIVRVDDPLPRFSADGQLVAVRDNLAALPERAVLVTASGSVKRGPLSTVRVGRFDIDSYAGIPDPATQCNAAAMSLLPPLVEYPGPYYLPADLVID